MDFIPYGRQNISKDDIQEVINTLQSSYLTTGPKVKEFEDKICQFTNAKYCVCVSNGTAALHLSSLILLNKNDKVLTTVNSFIATSNSILYANAKPIFIDIYEDGNINLDLCEEYLKNDSSIKAIYAVSFSGKLLDQEKLHYLQVKYNVKILEDNSHAMGAKLLKSDISIFSFHPVKHMTTAEGGAIITNNKSYYEQLIKLRNHGQDNCHNMTDLGFNYRLNDISCALGISQLSKLNTFIQKRQNIAHYYENNFNNTIIKPLYAYTKNSLYHLYVIKINFDEISITKDELLKRLKERNIGTQIHYQKINNQAYYQKLGYGNELTPNMDLYFEQCISLPCYVGLSLNEQDYIISTLIELIND